MAEHTLYGWKEYQNFITNVPPRQEDIDFFSSVPWIRSYLHNLPNGYKPIPSHSRYRKGDASDTLFNKTINSADTIPHLLMLIKQTTETDGKRGAHELANEPDLIMLVHLGSEVNGFQDTLHGGILAALLDEALGCCLEGYRAETGSTLEKAQLFTAELALSYRAPVTTPGVVVVKSWVKGRQGRKWMLEGQIVGEDGKIQTEAKDMWISAKRDTQL